MGKADRISGFFWLFFGIFVSVESARLGLGALRSPGPGFLYFFAGIFVSVMALIIIIRAWFAESASEEPSERRSRSKAIYVLLSIFLYTLLMEPLGFIPVTLLFFLFILGIIEKKRWVFTVSTSIAVTVAAYLLFETALQSQLPKGILGPLGF